MNVKIIILFLSVGMLSVNCQSNRPKLQRDQPYQETGKEREEFERNSYPNCMYYNTCTNYNGSSGDSGQKSAN